MPAGEAFSLGYLLPFAFAQCVEGDLQACLLPVSWAGDSYFTILQANWLKSVGVGKGDAVAIYMPMICELPSEAQLLPQCHSMSASISKYIEPEASTCCRHLLSVTICHAVAMLACARIGAVHSVVFGGFSAESLSQRVADAK